ncbi:2-octaprenylphenol hydroxylase [Candidatus Erwinia haradaeae]|uniref:2-octaprenylphenol hydroxylase n=1 Tax=Candidatus Erwinia haradaeae TaxID=1922217 RepID=A0A451DLT9_9GAMM|nr:FAD-dependent monooxygenase [Candidatus Erwinia haradaeae]VFP87717.1 2-octaprenylphenol hydroxylase [Candidatus Erwinia haradaeae]
MDHYDIVIFGGGIVGLSVAYGLKDIGLRVVIIESVLPRPDIDKDILFPNAKRFSALNQASKLLFQYFGIWNHILNTNTSAFYRVEAWERDSFGYINFDEGLTKNHLRPLGYVIENQEVHGLLWQHVSNLNHMTIVIRKKITGVSVTDKEALISFTNGTMISTSLIVAADGTHSWLRQHAKIPALFWDYRHHALIANIRTEIPHKDAAYQVFHANSVLAFLPLKDPYLSAIVWSLPPEKAEYLMNASERVFNQKLSVSFDVRLGLCNVVGSRQVFPLQGCYAQKLISNRLVLVGNSAHTIHPLAGQGLNIGLMDAAELIGEVRRLQHQGKDIGKYQYLRRYERQRRYNTHKILLSTEGCYRIFMGDHLGKKILRDSLLRMVNQLPGIKSYLLEHAQGMTHIPNWLR